MEKKGRVTVEEHAKSRGKRDDGRSRLNPISFFFYLFPFSVTSTPHTNTIIPLYGRRYPCRQAHPPENGVSRLRYSDKISCATGFPASLSLAESLFSSESAIHGFDSVVATSNKLLKVAKVQLRFRGVLTALTRVADTF